jgi:ABC-type lipoprotein release transport system permease subunit
MTRWTLLLRTFLFHWRTNLAVGLGVVAGTAVIGGALIVGDSVRGSLRDMTLARLGPVDQALTGPRFFREELATDLEATTGPRLSVAVPAILLSGSLEKRDARGSAVLTRAGRANVVGLNELFWKLLTQNDDLSPPEERQVILTSRLARDLEVKAGDEVTLMVELPSDIPRDALLGKRDEAAVEIPLTVRVVLADVQIVDLGAGG